MGHNQDFWERWKGVAYLGGALAGHLALLSALWAPTRRPRLHCSRGTPTLSLSKARKFPLWLIYSLSQAQEVLSSLLLGLTSALSFLAPNGCFSLQGVIRNGREQGSLEQK